MKTTTRRLSRSGRKAPSGPARRAAPRWFIAVGVLGAISIAIAATCAIAMLHLHASEPAPAGMVWIPGGEFVMGTDDTRSMPNERPAHRVKIDPFWMDEHDVTNAEFREFAEATNYVTTA